MRAHVWRRRWGPAPCARASVSLPAGHTGEADRHSKPDALSWPFTACKMYVTQTHSCPVVTDQSVNSRSFETAQGTWRGASLTDQRRASLVHPHTSPYACTPCIGHPASHPLPCCFSSNCTKFHPLPVLSDAIQGGVYVRKLGDKQRPWPLWQMVLRRAHISSLATCMQSAALPCGREGCLGAQAEASFVQPSPRQHCISS
jgi:hypothetical protein